MDVFEKFNSKFGGWYERLFGGGSGELRPKDVLRKLMAAMEDNRKEGLDGKIYVPNKYVLELAVGDPEERDYLLSFLDEEELVGVLQRFMGQNKYHARGPLDFTIAEVPEAERAARQDKLRVKARFEKGEIVAAAPGTPTPLLPLQKGRGGNADIPSASPLPLAGEGLGVGATLDDLPTVPGLRPADDDLGTVPAVAWATLAITSPEGRKTLFSLTRPTVTMGRSRNAGNDLILDSDGMVSKSHARIERERDGRFTLYDQGSMNGVFVNNERIQDNRALADGDAILIGGTQMVFQQAGETPVAASLGAPGASFRRARLTTPDGESHILASETLIGRAVTADIVINTASVSTKHARIVAPNAQTYYLEDLDSEHGTKINGRLLAPRQRTLLAGGDRITLGTVEARFSSEEYSENGSPR